RPRRHAGRQARGTHHEPLPGAEIRRDRHGFAVRGRDREAARVPGNARFERPVFRPEWRTSVMNCERIREQIPEALAGRLNKADREALVEHLEGCAGCRTEVAELNAVWRGLETVKSGMDDAAPDPEGTPGAKVRFQEMLAAY